MEAAIEEEEKDQQRCDDQRARSRHAEVRHELGADPPQQRERERQRAEEDGEERLEQAIPVPHPHVARGEGARRRLHHEHADRNHEAGQGDHRADDRGQHRAGGRRRVLPVDRKRDRLLERDVAGGEHRTAHHREEGREPEAPFRLWRMRKRVAQSMGATITRRLGRGILPMGERAANRRRVPFVRDRQPLDTFV